MTTPDPNVLKLMAQSNLDSSMRSMRNLLTDLIDAANLELARMQEAEGNTQRSYTPLASGALKDHPEYRVLAATILERQQMLKVADSKLVG